MHTSTKDLSFVVWGTQILFNVLKLLNHVLKFENFSTLHSSHEFGKKHILNSRYLENQGRNDE
jgi:hypothetical protein